MIQKLIDFLAPFEKRRIRMDDGDTFTILAIEDGTGATTGQEWRLLASKQGRFRVFIGTISGMGFSNDPPAGQTLFTWYEFNPAVAEGQTYVCIEFEFEPNAEEIDAGWRVADGGTILSATLRIFDFDDMNDFEEETPEVNVASGAVVTNGKYLVVIGRVGPGGSVNSRIGPLMVFFCAPNTFGVVSDGNDFVVV